MQEMTMVERVANALLDSEVKWLSENHPEVQESDVRRRAEELYEAYDVLARAAIEAMRDPSEKLMEKADLDNDKSPAPYCTDWSYFRMQINAMIDAALSE